MDADKLYVYQFGVFAVHTNIKQITFYFVEYVKGFFFVEILYFQTKGENNNKDFENYR